MFRFNYKGVRPIFWVEVLGMLNLLNFRVILPDDDPLPTKYFKTHQPVPRLHYNVLQGIPPHPYVHFCMIRPEGWLHWFEHWRAGGLHFEVYGREIPVNNNNNKGYLEQNAKKNLQYRFFFLVRNLYNKNSTELLGSNLMYCHNHFY